MGYSTNIVTRNGLVIIINIIGAVVLLLFALDTVSCFPYIAPSAIPTTSSIITRRDVFTAIPITTTAMTSKTTALNSNDNNNNNNDNNNNYNNDNDTSSMSNNGSSPAIRWGIIGLGDVCTQKAGPAFYKCHGSTLVAVTRRTPGKAKQFAYELNANINHLTSNNNIQCTGYETIESFLNHPGGLDAVYVSTRPGTHYDICAMVAKAGYPCYVEKPVGRCAAETSAIVQLFQTARLPLYTAFISRAYNRTQAIRTLLHNGSIGDTLHRVTYKLVGNGGARDMEGDVLPWRLDAAQSGGGLLMDVGCHVIDRIEYICGGSLVDVKGTAQNRNSPQQSVEDYVHFTAMIGESTSSGATMPNTKDASIDCEWDFGNKENLDVGETLTIIGSNGSIIMTGTTNLQVWDKHGNLVQEQDYPMPEHTAQPLIQAVTDELRGARKSDVLSYGDGAIRAQTVMDSCLTEYYGGREIGYWDRSQSWPGCIKQ